MHNINVYIKNRQVLELFFSTTKTISETYNFILHSSLQSLKNELELHDNVIISILDVEEDFATTLTKKYFEDTHKYIFLGVGFSKSIDEILILFESNIKGYIDLSSNSSSIMTAIEEVKSGRFYVNDYTKDKLTQTFFNSPLLQKNSKNNNTKVENSVLLLQINVLTEKEKNVCNLLCKGLSYKGIAAILGITTYTVNQKARNIFKKLKVASRAELSFKMLSL